jgi:hypothetical protein
MFSFPRGRHGSIKGLLGRPPPPKAPPPGLETIAQPDTDIVGLDAIMAHNSCATMRVIKDNLGGQ